MIAPKKTSIAFGAFSLAGKWEVFAYQLFKFGVFYGSDTRAFSSLPSKLEPPASWHKAYQFL
jgi:hypothetical protein